MPIKFFFMQAEEVALYVEECRRKNIAMLRDEEKNAQGLLRFILDQEEDEGTKGVRKSEFQELLQIKIFS